MRALLGLALPGLDRLGERALDVLEREVDEHRRAAGERGGRARVPVVGGHRAAERHVHVRVAVDEARHQPRAGDVDDLGAVARQVDADRRRSSRRRPATSARNEPSAVTTVPPAKIGRSCVGTSCCALGEARRRATSTMWSASSSVSDSGGASAMTLSRPAAVSTLRPTSSPRCCAAATSPAGDRARRPARASPGRPPARCRSAARGRARRRPAGGRRARRAAAPAARRRRVAERSSSPSSSMIAIVSSATAQPAGWPPNVLMWRRRPASRRVGGEGGEDLLARRRWRRAGCRRW